MPEELAAAILTTGGRGALDWNSAARAFAEAIAPCAEKARAAGIALGIEPTSHLYSDVSIAHRLSAVLDAIDDSPDTGRTMILGADRQWHGK